MSKEQIIKLQTEIHQIEIKINEVETRLEKKRYQLNVLKPQEIKLSAEKDRLNWKKTIFVTSINNLQDRRAALQKLINTNVEEIKRLKEKSNNILQVVLKDEKEINILIDSYNHAVPAEQRRLTPIIEGKKEALKNLVGQAKAINRKIDGIQKQVDSFVAERDVLTTNIQKQLAILERIDEKLKANGAALTECRREVSIAANTIIDKKLLIEMRGFLKTKKATLAKLYAGNHQPLPGRIERIASSFEPPRSRL